MKRSKYIIILIVLLFNFTAIYAQTAAKLGINGGMTYFGIRGNQIAKQNQYDFNYLAGTSLEFV